MPDAPTTLTTPTPTRRRQTVSTVLHNTSLCREHYKLVLALKEFPETKPGQFLQVTCGPSDHPYIGEELAWSIGTSSPNIDCDLQGPNALLRRPFSLAGRRDTANGVELELIHRVVGIGTRWLESLKPGDAVGIVGPLGNAFELPPSGTTALLVGGGVGIPPMLYLASVLNGRAIAFSGATTRDLLPFTLSAVGESGSDQVAPANIVEEFARHDIPSVITTDDGSYGHRGFITQALERFLDQSPGRKFMIYTCGPEPMMRRVADIAISRGIECQVAVERAMACGMGTCQSCCIKVKKPEPSKPPLPGRDWCYRLACTDGPIFRATDLLW